MFRSVQSLSLLTLVLLVWLLALFNPRLIEAQAEPPSTYPRSGAATEPTRAPRASQQLPEDPGSKPPTLPSAALDLSWKLVGTAVADDPAVRCAIIEDRSTRSQRAYQEGGYLGDYLIKTILDGEVVISTGTGDAVLSMFRGQKADALPFPQQIAQVPREEVASALPDETQLIREIGVRPRFEGGRPAGFVIYNVEPESIFGRMGLQDGDVIVGVNGRSFTTTQPTVEFYGALKQGGVVSLEVKREDGTRRLSFEIR